MLRVYFIVDKSFSEEKVKMNLFNDFEALEIKVHLPSDEKEKSNHPNYLRGSC